MTMSKKKTKIWLVSIGSVLLATLLMLSGIGLYFKFNPKAPETKVNPLDFSIDAWDGKSVGDSEYNVNYAGRGDNTRTIDSAEAFIYFVNEVNDGNTFEGLTVYLNKSIDLKGFKINSIGNELNSFKGTFDGGFYTLYNLNIEGNGLFGKTENATIKNIGLYNPTIKSSLGIAGGLIGTAINTKIDNTFVKGGNIKGEKVGGLVGEYIIDSTINNSMVNIGSTNVEKKISNSFVDTDVKAESVGALVHTLTSETEKLTIEQSYYTFGNKVVNKYQQNTLETNKVVNPNGKSSFKDWEYSSKYENGKHWCDYDYLEGSKELEFNYPVQSGFVKVYLTGSHYETVVITGEGPDDVVNVTNLSEAFTEVNDTTQQATINLIVEKVFMEARAETSADTVITVNAVTDTTLVRGTHNEDSMFVATENSKIVLGSATETLADGTEAATITLDGNREYVEENNKTSGALVVGYGGDVEIHDNVVLQNNVNNSVGYGGAVLIYGSENQNNITPDVYNCSATYAGGGVCSIGTSPENVGSFYNCSAGNMGGALAFLGGVEETESIKAMTRLYGHGKEIRPVRDSYVLSTTISGKTYNGNSVTVIGSQGGAIYAKPLLGPIKLTIKNSTFLNNLVATSTSESAQGGALYLSNCGATISGSNFTNNKAEVRGSTSFALGGAIYHYTDEVSDTTKLELNSSTSFVSCYAINKYSSNYSRGGAVHTNDSITLNGTSFTNCGSYTDSSGNVYLTSEGGAIWGNVTAAASSTNNFDGNSASRSGGAIYGTVNIYAATFKNNEAAYGGAIYGTTTISGGTIEFSSNIASNGGAVYGAVTIYQANTSVPTKVNFTQNEATYGGAIYSTEAVTLQGNGTTVSFTDNNATSFAAVYAETIDIQCNTSFTNNTASSSSSGYKTQIYAVTALTIRTASLSFSSKDSSISDIGLSTDAYITVRANISSKNYTVYKGGATYFTGSNKASYVFYLATGTASSSNFTVTNMPSNGMILYNKALTGYGVIVRGFDKPTLLGYYYKDGSTYEYLETGTTIIPTISNFQSSYMTKSGTTSATNVNNYSITIAFTGNYYWLDGTNSNLTLKWRIRYPYITLYDESGNITQTVATKTGTTSVYTNDIDNPQLTSIIIPTKTGYTFNGWYTTKTGGSQVISATGTLTSSTVSGYTSSGKWKLVDCSRGLYQHWTANTYTVAYNGNGATSGSTASSTHTYDTAKALTTNGFTKAYTVTYNANGGSVSKTSESAAYTFAGWATSASGSVAYTNSQSVSNLTTTKGATINLYAIWTSGTTGVGTTASSKTVILPTPTRTGYTFKGWYTTASGGTNKGGSGASCQVTASINLYAQWTANTYTVKYNGNGNTGGSTANSTHTYDTAKTLTANGFTKTAYSFAGWSTSASGSVVYTNSQSVQNLTSTNGGTVTLYAQWTPITYTVTIATTPSGYGTVDKTSVANVPHGSTITVGNNIITVNGTPVTATPATDTAQYDYEFSKWSVSNGASVTGTLTITATFTRTTKAYVVTWKSQDGATTLETDNGVAYGTKPSFDGTNPTKASTAQYSYTFVGWNTSANQESGTAEANLGVVTGAVTYYAAFSKTVIPYTVKVQSNNTSYGTVSAESVANVPYGSKITVSNNTITVNGTTVTATPKTITGYTCKFSSWSVANNATITGNLTITATFTKEANNYVVAVDHADATNLIPNPSFENTGWSGGGVAFSTDYKHSGSYSVKCTGTTSSSEILAQTTTTITITAGHIYYASVYGYQATKTSGATVQCYWPIAEPSFGSVSVGDAGKWNLYSFRIVRSTSSSGTTWTGNHALRFDFDNRKVAGVMYFDSAKLIDLTATYGAGKEPTKEWCDANLNGMQSVSATYDSAMPSITVPTRTGYTFNGIYDAPSGGTQYYTSAGASVRTWNKAANTTLYAQWTPITYTVAYNGNGATSGSTASSTHTYDVAKALTAEGFTKAYIVTYNYNGSGASNTTATATYTFAGWKIVTDVYTYAKYGTSSSTVTTAITSSTVIPNGAYVINLTSTKGYTVNAIAQWTSASITLPTPTRTGYNFKSWNTQADGKGTEYKAGAVYTPTKAITLYAQWTPITYTVAYNGNGATSGSTASSTHTYDVAKALTAEGFTKAYTVTYNYNGSGASNTTATATYTFAGWATSASGAVAYTNSQSVKNLTSKDGETVNLYAIWTSGTTGVGTTASSKTVTLPTPTRTGYNFKGWNTQADGKGISYSAGETYTPTRAITLYAIWEPAEAAYTVYHYLEKIDNTATLSTSNCTLTETQNLIGTTAASVTPAVKTYTGFTAPSTQTVTILADGSIKVYYYYTRNSYALTLSKGTGISAVTGAGTYDYGKSVAINATVSTGYSWNTWTQSTGTAPTTFTATTKSQTIVMGAGAVTLTANATLNTSTIKLGTATNCEVYYGTSSSNISTKLTTTGFKANANQNYYFKAQLLTENGYTLSFNAWSGWFSETTETSSAHNFTDNGNTYTINAAATKTANAYTVTYDTNGGYKNLLLNSDVENVKTNSSVGWDNSLNGTIVASSGWSSGYNSDVSNPTIGYHAHVATVNGNHVIRFKTNEAYSSSISALRWLGINQQLTTLVAGHTYRWTMDIYRVSGTGNIYGGPYYATTSNTSNAFQSGTSYFKPATNGVWETITNTFTIATDITSSTVTLYIYGYSAQGEIYVDNITLIDITSGANQTTTVTETYGSNYQLAPTVPARLGYTFAGWYTSASGGTQVTTSTKVSTAGAHNLYAHWTPITYTVAYNGNGSTSGSTASSSHTYDVAKALTVNGFTKTGYHSIGWNTKANGTGTSYLDAASVSNLCITNGGTINLYAQWEINTYKVTWKSQDGSTILETDNSVAYGTKPSFDGTNPTKASTAQYSYTFVGWNTSANQESGTAEASLSSVTGAVTYYAAFSKTVRTYTVTVQSNNTSYGTVSPTSVVNVPYGSTITVSGNTIKVNGTTVTATPKTITGYTVSVSWSVANNATVTGELTITATFIATPITYTIAFDANGGSGTMSSLTGCKFDTSYTLTVNTFTRTGYTFAGWATSAIGSVAYADGASVKNLSSTAGATVTLYAKWTPITYTITYNGNGNNGGSTASSTHTYDTGKALTANGFTKTGYSFAGWATSASGSVAYADKASVKNLSSTAGAIVTLYAKWTINNYTVTANANGGTISSTSGWSGTGTTATKSVTYNSTYGTLPTPTRNGYTFAGWETNLYDQTMEVYKAGYYYDGSAGAYVSNAEFSCYIAYLSPNASYTITNSGQSNVPGYGIFNSSGTVIAKKNYANTKTITFTSPSNASYIVFSVVTDSTSYRYDKTTFSIYGKVDSTIKMVKPVNHTLTAKWNLNTYTITYNLDGGSVSPANPTSYTVETASFTLNNPTKSGYTFDGWTGSNGTTASKSVTIAKGSTEDKTYTANWKLIEYTISCNLNGGAVDIENPTKYTVETASFTLNNPTKIGYTFTGWTGSNGTTASTNVIIAKGSTGNKSYTANWKINTFTVTIVSNNTSYGTVNPGEVKLVPYGSTITFNGNKFTIVPSEITGETISGTVQATATAKEFDNTYYYEFKNWTVNGTTSTTINITNNITVTANFIRLVEITVEAEGVNGNNYGINVYNENNTLIVSKSTQSFKLETDKTYIIKAVYDLTSDEVNNKYQILRLYINDSLSQTRHSLECKSDETTIHPKGLLTAPKTIKFTYLSSYFLTVKMSENSIGGITLLSETNTYNNVIIRDTSHGGYMISNGTEVEFSINSTPTSTPIATFIGFEYVANGESYIIGVNGGSDITFESFSHNSQHTNNSDIGMYYYKISSEQQISSIEVLTIQSFEVDIEAEGLAERITLTSVHGFNKVIDSSTESIILYQGEWEVESNLTLAEIQAVFYKQNVTQDENGKIIIHVVYESGN